MDNLANNQFGGMNGRKSKINMCDLKKFSEYSSELKIIDSAIVLKSMLSTQLPAKRTDGIVNLLLATRPSATINEVQMALVSFPEELILFLASKPTFHFYILGISLWT